MKRTTEVIADHTSGHITPVGGNVFAGLGFNKTEARALQAQAREVIAKKLAIKTQLMDSLAQWMAQVHSQSLWIYLGQFCRICILLKIRL